MTKRRRFITKDKDQKVRPNRDNANLSNPSATLSKISSSEGVDEASEISTSTIKLPPGVSCLRKSRRMVAGVRLTPTRRIPSKSPHLFDSPDKSKPQGQIKNGSDDVPQEDEPEQKGNPGRERLRQ